MEHLRSATVRRHGLAKEDASKLYRRYLDCVGGLTDSRLAQSVYLAMGGDISAYQHKSAEAGQKVCEWSEPTNALENEVALDAVIATLVQVHSQPIGTLVKLPERCIKWLIHQA